LEGETKTIRRLNLTSGRQGGEFKYIFEHPQAHYTVCIEARSHFNSHAFVTFPRQHDEIAVTHRDIEASIGSIERLYNLVKEIRESTIEGLSETELYEEGKKIG